MPGITQRVGGSGTAPTVSGLFDIFNVDDYGAVGDGTTDDLTALNDTIALAEAVGNQARVQLTPGKIYAVQGYIEVDGSGDIAIFGNDATIKQIGGGVGNQTLFLGKPDVYIERLTIDGGWPTYKGVLVRADTAGSPTVPTDVPANQIRLDAGASGSDDAYNGYWIWLVGGTGSGQNRYIRDYDGATKVATVYGNWKVEPDATTQYEIYNYSSSGIGINILTDNVHLRDVMIQNTKGDALLQLPLSVGIKLEDCYSLNTGGGGYHLRGDRISIDGLYIRNVNLSNIGSGVRALEIDPQCCDCEYVDINKLRIDQDTDQTFTDGVLFDPADGDLTTGDRILTAGGGASVNVRGFAAFDIDAGAGFEVGDMFYVGDSSFGDYNLKAHVIREITGTHALYARVISATTLTLHATPEDAEANANILPISGGSGSVVIKGHRSGVRTTIASISSNVITTAAAHGMITAARVRLTPTDSAVDVFPTGLLGTARIVTTSPYSGGGDTGATYRRPKRIVHAKMNDVRINWHASSDANCNGIKVSNVDLFEATDLIINGTPVLNGMSADDLRLAQGLRTVRLNRMRLSGTLNTNISTYVPDCSIRDSVIGDNLSQIPVYSFTTGAFGRLLLDQVICRFSNGFFDVGDSYSIRDDDIIDWFFKDVTAECRSSSRGRVFDVASSQLLSTGKIRFERFIRRNVGTYAGLTISAVETSAPYQLTLSSYHQLVTGDEIYLASTSVVPQPADNVTKYYARKTDNNKITVHTTKAGAFSDADKVQWTGSGAGTKTAWSRKLAVQWSNNGNRDFIFDQVGSSGREFVALAQPSGSVVAYQEGDIVWAMHKADGEPPGWICTVPGVPGSTVGTFVALPELGALKA